MQKTRIDIKGMHCKSCEIVVKEELEKVKGISDVSVSYRSGCAYVTHASHLSENQILHALNHAGYSFGENNSEWFSRSVNDYVDILIIVVALGVIYFSLREIGIFSFSVPNVVSFNSLGAVFFAGLTAGLSTCMALVGGIILGIGARYSEVHPHASTNEKLKPQLFFNAGRIVSFIILGGLMGFVGSVISISETGIGVLTILASLMMLFIGLQLTKLFPILDSFSISLPMKVYSFFRIKEKQNQVYTHASALVLGALTFFVPCGFTQAVQIFAVSTGNIFSGAAVMGIFALGTLPGLMGIGSLSSFIKGNVGRWFFKISGIVLIGLSLINAMNGYRLIGLKYQILSLPTSQKQGTNVINLENGFQVVRMDQETSGYYPNTFTIKKGIPVKWIVNSKSVYSCASNLIAPAINVRKSLELGENVFEFTPQEVGSIRFSCSMGMYTGEFRVVE
jgi:sulfite exporter TauE/SafE/copper chaperone CopZ